MMNRVLALGLCMLLAGCASGPRIDTRHASVGHDSRVQFIVLHYTSSDLERSLDILKGDGVSSHYLIGESPATTSGGAGPGSTPVRLVSSWSIEAILRASRGGCGIPIPMRRSMR